MAGSTRRVPTAPPFDTAATRGARASWRRFLSIVAMASLVTPLPGCVTETKRRSGLDPRGRSVSVELRRPIVGIGYDGILFTPLDAKGAHLLGWSPSEFDIARMEARLPEILPEAGPRLFADGPPDLAEYRRQYSGHLANDRRIIQVNYIHFTLIKERNLDWKQRRLPVYDVSSRYFQIWYDLDAARIVKLSPDS